MKIKLDEGAFIPEIAHITDAGADLKSPVRVVVPAGESVVINTGVHVEIPRGYCGMIKSKSGLNVKHGILSEGVIDSGYTGAIHVKLYNFGPCAYVVEIGDKISQLCIIRTYTDVFMECMEIVESLPDTERGDNGFGSTGR